MQKALFDAAAGNKELSTVFGSLGIDVKKGLGDTEGTLIKLADQFAKMPDGAEKSALAMKVFGKAGAELIPLLNEGGESLRRMIEDQKRWGGVSEETASRADAFNDTVAKLQMMLGAFFREVAAAVLPTLQALANMFVEAKEKGGGFAEIGQSINTGLKWLAGGAMAAKAVLEQLGNVLGGVGALVVAFFKGELFTNGGAILDGIREKNADISGKLGEDISRIFDAVPEAVKPAATKAGKGIAGHLAAGVKDGFGSILAGLDQKLAGSMSPYNKTVVETEVKLREFERTTRKVTDAEREQALTKAFLIDRMKLQKDMLKQLSDAQEEYDAAGTADIVKGDQILKSLTDGNELLKQEINLVGESARVRALRNVEFDRERALSSVNDAAQREKINREYDIKAALIQQRDALQENIGLWERGADLAAGFAQALTGGVGSAVDYLKKQFKSLLAEMVAIFGKRWFLNMAAGATGMSSLSAMASQQGQGSIAGNLLDVFTSGGGGMAGSLLSSVGGGIIGMGGGFAGGLGAFVGGIGELGLLGSMGASTSAGITALGAGNIAGGLGSLLGPAAIAIGAIYALHKAFGDKGENWKGQLGFGGSANAYATQGIFGPEGFKNLQGNDATNRSIQAFMAGTGGIDKLLAGGLSSEQMAAIQAQLAGYNRRTDGQPAEFAFSKDDKTAAAQLTLEYLKVKYGTVFDQIDKTFADYVRAYTGTSEDLVKEIGLFAQLVQQLSGATVKGLSLENLRKMQTEGEELGTTLQRITQGMATVNSVGVDQTESFLAAFRMVQDEFAAAGTNLPVNIDSYRALRSQIDLSTESGRAMFEMLVRVAPAMQQIEQATKQMLDGFNANLGQIFGSGVTRQYIESKAVGLVSQFQSMTGLLGGLDPLAVFRGIGGANPGDIQYLMNTGGPELKTVLSEIISLYAQYNSLQDRVNTSTQQLGTVTAQVVDRMGESRNGIAEWLRGLFMDDRLSPLSPEGQLDFAQSQYVENLMKAQAGDANALAQYTSFAQAYLEELRAADASGARYQAGAAAVATQAAGLSGLAQVRPVTAADTAANTQEIVKALNQLRADLGQANATNAELLRRLARSTDINGDKQQRALNDATMAW
ncbi:MAG: hypothetical protein JNM76_14585 [Betaproteobacteria bacterium]|nr:hypothetical protein [Betaproteobacteria bacterium]